MYVWITFSDGEKKIDFPIGGGVYILNFRNVGEQLSG